jgi:Mrp family chromosome partitioning ATPase
VAILPDANLLAAMIDTALLVVSAKSTPYPLVQRAAQAVGAKRILGVVLNRADHAVLPVAGYYGYAGNHMADAKPRRWFRFPSLRKQHPKAVVSAARMAPGVDAHGR